jgi:hypothetical protein
MTLASLVSHNKEIDPPRILLYGTNKIGKSTFGSFMPKPIFVQADPGGAKHLGVAKLPTIETYSDFDKQLALIENDDHDYQTLVIDTVDWLERRIFQHVATNEGKNTIADVGFGRGYALAVEMWNQLFQRFDRLVADRRMAILLIAHSQIQTFNAPDSEPYDRYLPDLDKRSVSAFMEWVDAILFVNYRVYTKKAEEKFGKKVYKATGGDERIVYATERPSHLAGNRYYLPPELPFSWAAVQQGIVDGRDKAPVDVFTDEMPEWASVAPAESKL